MTVATSSVAVNVQSLTADSIHLYRRLLRAATYIPDSFAGAYCHNRIISRFKTHARKRPLPHVYSTHLRLVKKRLSDARKDAASLERAGHGSLEDLKKVLLLTYGRGGERKRVLMKDLLASAPGPSNSAMVEQLYHGSEQTLVEFEPPAKFKEFLQSQRANSPIEHPKYKIKQVTAVISETNIWERPMPKKREVNLRKRWWAYTLNKMLPPVPHAEWEQLRELATGLRKLELRKRRSLAIIYHGPLEEDALVGSTESKESVMQISGSSLLEIPVQRYSLTELLNPIRSVYKQVDEMGQLKKADDGEITLDFPHSFNPRAVRRLYASIWAMTATMIQVPQTQKWNIKWGEQRTEALNGQFTKASHVDRELFVGLNVDELPAHNPTRKIGAFLKAKHERGKTVSPQQPREKTADRELRKPPPRLATLGKKPLPERRRVRKGERAFG